MAAAYPGATNKTVPVPLSLTLFRIYPASVQPIPGEMP